MFGLAEKEVTEQGRIEPFRDAGFRFYGIFNLAVPVTASRVVIWGPHVMQPTEEEIIQTLKRNRQLPLTWRSVEDAFDGWTGVGVRELQKTTGMSAIVTAFPRINFDTNRSNGTKVTTVTSMGNQHNDVKTEYPNTEALEELVGYFKSARERANPYLSQPFLILGLHGMADYEGAKVIVGTRYGKSADWETYQLIADAFSSYDISVECNFSGGRKRPGNEVLEWLRQDLGGPKMQAVQIEVVKEYRQDRDNRRRLISALARATADFSSLSA